MPCLGTPLNIQNPPLFTQLSQTNVATTSPTALFALRLMNLSSRPPAFFSAGVAALNVTLPFKERAFQLADESSDRANQARAANCLIPLPGGKLRADNTDGVGMIRDMVANHGWQLSGRQVLVLGAGGAARGVMHPLLMENPAQVIVANRTAERAQALAAQFSGHKVPVSGGGFESLQGQTFDLIINGTQCQSGQ